MLWMVIGGGAVLFLLLIAAAAFYFVAFDRRSAEQRMAEEDGADLVRRWARAAYAIVTGGHDYGRVKPNLAQNTLRAMWSITDAAAVYATLYHLARMPSGNAAWDGVRLMVVGRLAVGAGWLPDEESWALIARMRTELQRRYPSWDALAADYMSARARWAAETSADDMDDVQFNIDEARKDYWGVIAFRD
jgi:hypothetical protein